ncbi:MAG: hypothetical protein GEU98_19885 [Pseudonocardiaceae bacterium]|nr:hypothetical protein [Pseudonocardiaceae bacterium]
MTFHIVAIAGLLAVFVLGTFSPVNLGALAMVAAFLVGTLMLGEEPDAVLAGFPADMFVLILGVTYLFGIAAANGTLEWLLEKLVRLVRGNAAVVPPLIFLLTSGLVSVGAIAPAVSAMFARLSLGLAKRLNINPMLVSLMVITGGCAGSFSPISLLGLITNTTLERNDLTASPVGLYLLVYGYNLALAVVAYLIYGGVTLVRRQRVAVDAAPASSGPGAQSAPPATDVENDADAPRLTPPRIATLAGILVLAVGLLGFGLDVGMLSLLIAVVLHLVFQQSSKGALDRVSWQVIVLICGVVTYVEVMERGGTIEALGNSVVGLQSPLLVTLLLCAVGAVVSAFASSTGVISAMIALIVPFLASGSIGVLAVVAAIALSATVVDACPFSSTSALIVANAPEDLQRRIFRGLGKWAFGMVLTAPVATVLLLVAPGWL